MGFSISWIAFKGVSLAKAALAFGLIQTGQTEEVMDFPLSGAQVGDWAIIVAEDLYPKLADERELVRLSRRQDIVVVHVNETTMLFWASRWHGGREIWEVRHEGENDHRHLEVEGDLPPEFTAVRDKWLATQDKEDARGTMVDFVSEIPIDLAEGVTGFRHDTFGTEFFELVPGAPL